MKKSKVDWLVKFLMCLCLFFGGAYIIDDIRFYVGVLMMIWANNVDREI